MTTNARQVATATDLRVESAKLLRDAEYGITTVITRDGKHVATVVPPGASGSLDPERIDRALRAVIAELDYDLHKALSEDTYRLMVADFIRTYQRPTIPTEETP
jgi:antitoxin (DNA-binding transcriptional repressor) of toxin-antitoxin stability system